MRHLIFAITLTACGGGVTGDPVTERRAEAGAQTVAGGAESDGGVPDVSNSGAPAMDNGGEGGASSGAPSVSNGGSPETTPDVESGGAPVGEGGSVSTAGTGGAAGTAGTSEPEPEPEPDIDECSQTGVFCDGLCGQKEPSPYCKVCNGFGASSGYIVLGGRNNPTNQVRRCDWPDGTTRLIVAANTCARFTVQPGAIVNFMTYVGESEVVHKQCAVVSGMESNTATSVSVQVSRPSQNAWVHQENTALVMGNVCPLACP